MNRKIIIISSIVVAIMAATIISYYQKLQPAVIILKHNPPLQTSTPVAKQTVVLTKNAMDALIKKAADQQYLQDVLTSGPKLPLKQHNIHALPLPVKNTVLPLRKFTAQTAAINQHCSYKNQSYSIGEIVQTDKGWIRCTPSVVIDRNTSSQYGKAVWILKDNLLN